MKKLFISSCYNKNKSIKEVARPPNRDNKEQSASSKGGQQHLPDEGNGAGALQQRPGHPQINDVEPAMPMP